MVLIEGGERGPVNVCREDGWHLPPTYRFCGQVMLIANNQTKLRKVSRIRLPILNFRGKISEIYVLKLEQKCIVRIAYIFYLQDRKIYTLKLVLYLQKDSLRFVSTTYK